MNTPMTCLTSMKAPACQGNAYNHKAALKRLRVHARSVMISWLVFCGANGVKRLKCVLVDQDRCQHYAKSAWKVSGP